MDKAILNKTTNLETILFYGFGLLVIACTLLSYIFQTKIFLAFPALFPLVYFAITDFRKIYFALLFLLPLSLEYQVTESLGTDLPTEPLMLGLMFVLLFYFIKNIQRIDFSFFKNSIMILLIVHFFWIGITSFTSLTPLLSFKFILAKTWYIFAFLLATAVFIKSKNDIKKFFWIIYIPLTFTVIWALFWHGLTNFHFDTINNSLTPFYRNHVVYANLLTVFLPFVFLARNWYLPASTKRRLLNMSVIIYLAAIYFAFTRASYLALFAMLAVYFIVNFKMIKLTIFASILAIIGVFSFITHNNYYLKYSPTVKTVSHHDLSGIIDATLKGTDVSSMERIYRWIAAIHMANDRPITGFGPNGFVPNYENYTVFIFETWISENPERSGVHNYFLMTLVEQGVIGLIIFFSLIAVFFIFSENLFHKIKDKELQKTIKAIILSMTAIVVSCLFSDLLEVDKIGSFFFIMLAFIVIISRNFKPFIKEK